MAVDQAQQWLPDPAGKHQFRLHSDGKPTEWVSDDGSMTVDRLEPGPAVASVQPRSTSLGSASNSQPSTPATPPVRPAGWYRNASNPSEVRYWDGAKWAVDQTVATSTPATSPAPSVSSLSDIGSLPSIAPREPDTLSGAGPLSSVGPTAPSDPLAWVAPETTAGDDAPGRHSLGRTRSTETDGLLSGAPTVSSVWAQPDVPGDRTPAPTPTPAPFVAPAAPAAPIDQAAPEGQAPLVVTPPAGAPDLVASAPSVPLSTIPADWYPDPSNRTRLRYWDGAGWTEHVLDEAPAHRPTAAGPAL